MLGLVLIVVIVLLLCGGINHIGGISNPLGLLLLLLILLLVFGGGFGYYRHW